MLLFEQCSKPIVNSVLYDADLIFQKDIADMCAYCERYIGTQGGGMDQAISFMAQPGTVCIIVIILCL